MQQDDQDDHLLLCCGLLLNEVHDLAPVDTDKAVVLRAFFALVFTSKISQVSVTNEAGWDAERHQQRARVVSGITCKSVRPYGLHLWVLREMADVKVRVSFIICEISWRLLNRTWGSCPWTLTAREATSMLGSLNRSTTCRQREATWPLLLSRQEIPPQSTRKTSTNWSEFMSRPAAWFSSETESIYLQCKCILCKILDVVIKNELDKLCQSILSCCCECCVCRLQSQMKS